MQRSLLYLRKFWPRVDFNNGQFDFNNTGGIQATPYILSGSECLTFFLGGTPLNDGNGHVTGVSGFSKSSPLNPFDPTTTNRTVPNYEFNNGRLIDQDGDGMPSYIDPLNIVPGSRRGYAYFCSYGTNSYDPNDVNGYGHNQRIPSTRWTTSGTTPSGVHGRFRRTSSAPPRRISGLSGLPIPYTGDGLGNGFLDQPQLVPDHLLRAGRTLGPGRDLRPEQHSAATGDAADPAESTRHGQRPQQRHGHSPTARTTT